MILRRIKLMTHVVVGYPDIASTIDIIKAMAEAGADLVELQIPFSDPIADGPTIMKACDRALENGVTVDDCFRVMQEASKSVSVPLFFMGYYNTVFHYGVEKFCRTSHGAGAHGLIIPDMPPDEEAHEQFIKACSTHHLSQIRVVTPASSPDRLKLNAQVGNGFVYCVSHYGVTGSQDDIGQELAGYIARVRKYFDIPIALGFGISKPSHIRAIKSKVDIAVVGSAIIRAINASSSKKDMIVRIKKLVSSLKI